MMNLVVRMVLPLMTASLVCHPLFAQEVPPRSQQGEPKMMRLGTENAFILREVGVVITEEKGVIKVLLVPSKEQRPPEMPAVDLVAGDEVGMAAGKRIKTIKELKNAYDQTPVGDVFKLGVHRQGQAVVVSIVKKAAKDLPQGQQMIIRQSRSGSGAGSDFFPAFGIGIEKRGDDVVVSETLPNVPKDIQKGDVIKSVNGKEIKSIADFSKEFDATRVGGTFTLELLRGGKQVVVTTKRPEPQGSVIIRRKLP